MKGDVYHCFHLSYVTEDKDSPPYTHYLHDLVLIGADLHVFPTDILFLSSHCLLQLFYGVDEEKVVYVDKVMD